MKTIPEIVQEVLFEINERNVHAIYGLPATGKVYQLRKFKVKKKDIKPIKIHYKMDIKEKELVSFEETNFNLGDQKGVVTVPVRIKNLQNESVFITEFQRGCGCTSSDYPKILLPHSDVEIVVSINVKGNGIYTKSFTFVFESQGFKQKQSCTVTFKKV